MRFAATELPNSAAVTALKDGVHRGKLAAAGSHDGKRPDWSLIGTVSTSGCVSRSPMPRRSRRARSGDTPPSTAGRYRVGATHCCPT
ncbi:hypothetical protein SAMN05444580_101232 [Rhodococcus tukisamuensis]|uniref:Uncharacterized protein n=1 Tax=Rhodococcus tukisamuensis TaxID=168276 RepID=A0A1G6MM17_9NOCA|nr:hypothetical protein SAMN05444580_101232 [Rhodococcus tukisamuensis]